MKSEKTYRIHLVKSFKGASDAEIGAEASFDGRKYDSFHHRVTPIETFVTRIAAFVRSLDGYTAISSERSGFTAPRIEKTLTLRLGDQAFTVCDPWAVASPTAQSTHSDNCAFLESAASGVTAFSKAVAERWPSLSDEIAIQLGKLETRLRANCHDILRRAERTDNVVAMRAARDALRRAAEPK